MGNIRILATCCVVILLASGCALSVTPTSIPTQTPSEPVQNETYTPDLYPLHPTVLAPSPLSSSPLPGALTLIPTDTPIPSAAASPIPTLVPGIEPDPQQKILPTDLTEGNTILHDLILIETRWPFPFSAKYSPEFRDLIVYTGEGLSQYDNAFWAISPDGTRMGRLTPIGMNVTLYLPSSAEQKALAVEYGVHLNHPDLIAVSLPAECYETSENPDPCQHFKFSQDGRYLSYTFNDSNCARTMNILEVSTGQVAYQGQVNGIFPEYVPGDRAFVNVGHCEGGSTLLVDLKTGQTQKAGGYTFDYEWNKTQTAFLVHTSRYVAFIGRTFWGYDLQTGQLFSAPETNDSLNSPSTWAPDGTHILYEHREFLTTESGGQFVPQGTSQVIRMELASGKTQVILSDSSFDYWLCGIDHRSRCQFKHPDWVQVVRYPIPADPAELARYKAAVVVCLDERNCPPNPELMALNWHTGELLPWDQSPAAPPTSTPEERYVLPEDGNPRPPHPDEKPLFIHPSGEYAFYIGADGYSLWKVIDGYPPVLWVEAANNYLYLP